MKTLRLTDASSILLKTHFTNAVRGYHLINSQPIKECVWEHINALSLKKCGYEFKSESCGSHSPGCDIDCTLGRFSNKSTKYENDKGNTFKISSYRLTTVCSDSNVGTPETLINEINGRKNFSHYSVLVRSELPNSLSYDWYVFPSDHTLFNPASYEWVPSFGKKGKKTGVQIGWKTNEMCGSSMSVSFSMSSQLWVSVHVTEEMKNDYLFATVTADVVPILDYVKIYDIFLNGGFI